MTVMQHLCRSSAHLRMLPVAVALVRDDLLQLLVSWHQHLLHSLRLQRYCETVHRFCRTPCDLGKVQHLYNVQELPAEAVNNPLISASYLR